MEQAKGKVKIEEYEKYSQGIHKKNFPRRAFLRQNLPKKMKDLNPEKIQESPKQLQEGTWLKQRQPSNEAELPPNQIPFDPIAIQMTSLKKTPPNTRPHHRYHKNNTDNIAQKYHL